MKWEREALGQICSTSSGGTPNRKNKTFYVNGVIPWVKSGELRNNTIYFSEELITEEALKNSSAKVFPKGTLLIAMYGATIGKLAFLGIDAATNQAVCGIFKNSKVLLKYLYFYLLFQRPNLIKRGIGDAQPNISQTILKQLYVSYPAEIREQERIVARIEELFSELDKAVETLNTTKQQLAVYRQAVISTSFPELTSSNSVRLDEIAEISGGITKGRDLSQQKTITLPYLRVANVQNGYLDLSQMKDIEVKLNEVDKYLLQEGDVLYTEGGDRDKLGRGTVWKNEIPRCVHQNHIFKARLNQERALPQYVAYWSMSVYARDYFFKKGKQSVNLASINKTVLSALILPMPSLEEQASIINNIESRLSVCDQIEKTIEQSLQQAEALRQSILKQAFEGRL